jgi:hypothetical protein
MKPSELQVGMHFIAYGYDADGVSCVAIEGTITAIEIDERGVAEISTIRRYGHSDEHAEEGVYWLYPGHDEWAAWPV